MKSLIATISILGLLGMTLGVAVKAADTATVTATVTVQNISVSVSDGTVNYGIMPVGTWKSTLPSDMPQHGDMQTATNNGNVPENFNIKGQNSANWILANTPGDNEYTHQFCNDTKDDCATPTHYTALTTTYQTLATGILVNGEVDFHLRLGTPTSTTFYTLQDVSVTIQAVSAS